MFGSIFYNNPEILQSSLGDMNSDYKKQMQNSKVSIIKILQKFYIYILGVPEIGFRLRHQYFQAALKKINFNKIDTILDAGTGIGTYMIELAGKYPAKQITGWEIDKQKLQFVRDFCSDKKLENVKVECQDITVHNLKNNNYDLIYNIDVLEHIPDYKKALLNFYKLLNKNGYLFIHVPQINQKRYFKSLSGWTHEGHAREGFDPDELKEELKKIGFKIVKLKQTFGFFGSISWELNHLSISKSFILAGITFPFLLLFSIFDLITPNNRGLGVAILVQK